MTSIASSAAKASRGSTDTTHTGGLELSIPRVLNCTLVYFCTLVIRCHTLFKALPAAAFVKILTLSFSTSDQSCAFELRVCVCV